MGKYLSRAEIIKKIPKLKKGSFDYWVHYRAGISPHDNVQRGHMAVNVYHPDCIPKIKAAMGGKRIGEA